MDEQFRQLHLLNKIEIVDEAKETDIKKEFRTRIKELHAAKKLYWTFDIDWNANPGGRRYAEVTDRKKFFPFFLDQDLLK